MTRPFKSVLPVVFVFVLAAYTAAQQAIVSADENSKPPSFSQIVESGSFADGVYRNSVLGLTITVPLEWGISRGILQKNLSDADRAKAEKFFVETLPTGLRPLFRASLMDGALMLAVDAGTDKTEPVFLEELKKFSVKEGGWRVTKDVGPVTVSGTEFMVFDIEYIHNSVIKERFIARKHRGVMVLVVLFHSADKSLKALGKALETVKLEK